MRAALWLLGLFGVAVAGALLAGSNQGVVTLYWAPYRLDLSINLVVLLLVLSFALMHLALRALAALFELPQQARRWRAHQKERTLHATVFDALAQLMAGRYLRARKSAQQGLELAQSLQDQAVMSEPLRAICQPCVRWPISLRLKARTPCVIRGPASPISSNP